MNTLMTDCYRDDPVRGHHDRAPSPDGTGMSMACKCLFGRLLLLFSWMKNLSLILVAGLVLAGCGQGMTDARAEAKKNWDRMRAESLCSQAAEHLRLGQLTQASKLAEEAISLDEECDDARVVLSKAYIERGQYNSAADELLGVLRRRPGAAEPLYLLAVAHERASRFSEALEEYQAAYELDDSNLHAVLAATEVLVEMDRPHDARVYLARYADRADNDPAVYELAGRLAMMDGDYAAAVDQYRQACSIDMDNSAYMEALAVAQVLDGRNAQAISSLTRRIALKDEPACGWVYTMLGDCLMSADRLAGAHDAYERASVLLPDAPDSWVNLAKVLVAMKQMPQAAAAGAKALALDAKRLDASLLTGYALLQSGQSDQAVKVLQDATTLYRKNSTLLCALGRAYEALGRSLDARRCYTDAARANPSDALASALLAEMSSNGRQPDE